MIQSVFANNIFYKLIFLPAIIFIGLVTSYEDYFTSKIRNKWIVTGFVFSLLVFFSAVTLYYYGVGQGISYKGIELLSSLLWNIDKWFINLSISIIVAYSLWHSKMWGAGDAKLFIVYASLMPMGQYSKVYFDYYFASFFQLLAIFVPATIFLLLQSLIYLLRKSDFKLVMVSGSVFIKGLVAKFDLRKVAWGILGYFIFILFFKVIRQEVQVILNKFIVNQNILMLISLLLFKPLSKVFRRSKSLGIVSLVFMAYVILTTQSLRVNFFFDTFDLFLRAAVIMTLINICRKLIDLYSEKVFSETTPFAHWMFLGVLISWFWH